MKIKNNIIENFKKNKFKFLLFSTFCVGIALRLYNINKFSFWYDEVISIFISKKIFKFLFMYPLFEATPPFFFILLKIWLCFGQEGEFILRLLPLIFGVLSILGIYKIGKLLFNRKIGLISAFMISISPFHVYYSQELRAYSLITFLSMASMFFLIKALKENRPNLWKAYIVFTALCLYSHSYVVFLIIAQNIYFFIFCKSNYKHILKKWLIIQLAILFLYIPWLIISLIQLKYITTSWHYSWMVKANPRDFLNTFLIFSAGYAPVPLGLCSFLMIGFLFISGLRFCKQKKEQIYLLSIWLFAPVLIAVIISNLFFPMFLHRALIYASPSLYILSSLGVSGFKKRNLAVILVIFISLSALALRDYYKDIIATDKFYRIGITSKKGYKEATDYVQNKFKDGDIIRHTSHCTTPSFWFYSGQNGIERTLDNIIEGNFIENTMSLKNSIKGYKRIWLIYSEWNPELLVNNPDNEENKIKQWLDNNFILLDFKKFIGINIYLYLLRRYHK